MSSQEKMISPDLSIALASSRTWRDSIGQDGKPLFLAYESYEGINFSDEVFTEATLQEANLSRTCLDRVDAVRSLANGICLRSATLNFSNWTKAEMETADLSEVQAHDVLFVKTKLRNAQFYHSDLRRSNFTHAICIGANFSRAYLVGSNFSKALLDNADFTNTDISHVVLDGCHLSENTKFSGAIGLETAKFTYLFVGDEQLDYVSARRYLEGLVKFS
jgi:uncharacterized protein YjbI with pentapeptide repeats